MPHFYRLRTINDSTDHPKMCRKDWYCPSGHSGGLPSEWRRGMQEIPLDPPWPHCTMLRAPETPAICAQQFWTFRLPTGYELPDIWAEAERALVSERAKAVLEACDDFGHEFIETEIQNEKRQRINTQPYYLLNVRRILKIAELEGEIANRHKMFCPNYYEELFLPVLQQNHALMEKVAALPLWRQYGNFSIIYMNETVYGRLCEAGITGLNPYTEYIPKPLESIGRFE